MKFWTDFFQITIGTNKLIKFTPKILLTLVDNDIKVLRDLEQKVYEFTRVKFYIENVSQEFFDREKNNKVKFIVYEK